MQVAIIGAGIAGLTAAIALKKANIPFVIYEGASEIKPVGAGIAIANNAMQVYRHLGISQALSDKGMRISRVLLTDFQLNTLSSSDLTPFEKKYNLANIAILRSELHRVLLDQVDPKNIVLNKRLSSIETRSNNSFKLIFEDQSSSLHTYVIGADGIRSKTREQLFSQEPLRDAHQVCWRGTLNFNLPKEYDNTAVEGWGKSKRFGFVRLDAQTVYWYYLVNQKLYDHQNQLPLLLDQTPTLVKQMILQTPSLAIFKDNIYDLSPINSWAKQNICIIGDAAHATTPNLGQGACQAIEDVYTLSKLLEKYPLSEAFLRYPALRKKKVNQIVRDSRALGQMAQISNPLLITLRNTAFKMLPQWAMNQQMSSIFELDDPLRK